MGIVIEDLDPAAGVLPDTVFPAMRSGSTVKLTAEQLATFIIAIVTDSAPATLDTLNELAAALGDDPNFATTVTNALAAKATSVDLAASSRCLVNGRLTLASGSPVSASDVLAATTLYFTPYKGNQIGLYASGAWITRSFAEVSLSLSGYTTGKPYDIFGYDNAGSLALESLVWTNDTTRATALALQDGILVKSGDATRRYLGTIYTSATGQCEDSLAKRYVWNMYNRVARSMKVIDSTDTWTYTTDVWRQARNSAANQLDFVRGLDEDLVDAQCTSMGYNVANVTIRTSIGLDSSTAHSGITAQALTGTSASTTAITAFYKGLAGVGRHTLKWLEASSASGTTTWAGDAGVPLVIQSGMYGTLVA